MKQEKPILVYRIDEKRKRVLYYRCNNNENLLSSISTIPPKEITFDDLLRDAFKFNKEYPNTLTFASLEAGTHLGGGKEMMRACFAKLMPSNNFISDYYNNYFPEFFVSANRKVYEKAIKTIINTNKIKLMEQDEPAKVTARVCYLTNPKNFSEWNNNKFETTRVNYERIILHNDTFNIADDWLELFFYDFYYSLHKEGLHICVCKNCKNYFIGEESNEYCNEKKCQNKKKSEYEKNRRHQPYNAQITEVDSYIGDQRSKLKKATNADAEMLTRFEKKAKESHDAIRKKIKYYKEGGLDPQDKDMNKYIINLKHDLSDLVDNLINEFKGNNPNIKL